MAKQAASYENNPFMIGLEGVKLVFKHAKSVAIFAIVLIGIGFLGQFVQLSIDIAKGEFTKSIEQQRRDEQQESEAIERFVQGLQPEQLTLLGVGVATGVFLIIVISLTIAGIFDHTSARLRSGKDTTLKAALKDAFSHIASYLWLNIIIGVKVLLWSLLLIIPGIVMAVRYSLSGSVFFNEGLRGNAAVKRSLALTKGAWLTTFASQSLWNLITFGILQPLLQPGTNAILYRQFAEMTDTDTPKPNAHWLSWLTLVLPIALIVLFFLLILLIVVLLAASKGA